MAGAAKCGKLGLQRAHLGAGHELAMREHAPDRLVDGAAKAAALAGHIDERDRLLFHTRVLIHDDW